MLKDSIRNETQRPESINSGGETLPLREYEKSRESEENDNGGEDYQED